LDSALDKTVELYMSELRKLRKYVNQIHVRDAFHDRPPYRLIFCTDSAHGVELMSDISRKYEKDLFEEHEAGQSSLFAVHDNQVRRAKVYDSVMAAGLRRGSATSEELIHELTPTMFGEFESKEYRAAIRQLVNDGVIVRKDSVGIDPHETLKFVAPSQSSLLI
jgi:ribosomal protein L19E